MIVLTVGVDSTTCDFLTSKGFKVERYDEDFDDFNLEDWCDPETPFNAIIINIDKALGLYACRSLRRKNNVMCVVGISGSIPDRLWPDLRADFMENGGDDLLPHPVNPRELTATLGSIKRRINGSPQAVMQSFYRGDVCLKIDTSHNQAYVQGIAIHLTVKEYAMLRLLCENPNRVLTKEFFIMQMYYQGTDQEEPEIKIIDVFICKLRNRLKIVHPQAHEFIQTIWGRGYQLQFDKHEKSHV